MAQVLSLSFHISSLLVEYLFYLTPTLRLCLTFTDVAQTWKVAAFADIRVKDVATWALQPTGRTLLCTLVQHHAQYCDFQTVHTLLKSLLDSDFIS